MQGEQRTTILIIEDSPDEEVLIKRAISECCGDCSLIVSRTTDEALNLLFPSDPAQAGIQPDLILTDLKVATIGGAEFVSEVRAKPEMKLVPIVVFCGHSGNAQIEDVYRRGASSFVEKPMDYEQFAITVSRIVDYWTNINIPAPTHRMSARFHVR